MQTCIGNTHTHTCTRHLLPIGVKVTTSGRWAKSLCPCTPPITAPFSPASGNPLITVPTSLQQCELVNDVPHSVLNAAPSNCVPPPPSNNTVVSGAKITPPSPRHPTRGRPDAPTQALGADEGRLPSSLCRPGRFLVRPCRLVALGPRWPNEVEAGRVSALQLLADRLGCSLLLLSLPSPSTSRCLVCSPSASPLSLGVYLRCDRVRYVWRNGVDPPGRPLPSVALFYSFIFSEAVRSRCLFNEGALILKSNNIIAPLVSQNEQQQHTAVEWAADQDQFNTSAHSANYCNEWSRWFNPML